MQSLLTRRQAAESGQKRYYTGRPCNKGHDCQRFTSTGVCVLCASGYVKSYNSRLTKQRAAHAAGVFTYSLHPDDHATALAICQALDMQRGRVPATVEAAPPPEPFDPIAARQKAFGKIAELTHTAPVDASAIGAPRTNTLHPFMAAQLRAEGMLR